MNPNTQRETSFASDYGSDNSRKRIQRYFDILHFWLFIWKVPLKWIKKAKPKRKCSLYICHNIWVYIKWVNIGTHIVDLRKTNYTIIWHYKRENQIFSFIMPYDCINRFSWNEYNEILKIWPILNFTTSIYIEKNQCKIN